MLSPKIKTKKVQMFNKEGEFAAAMAAKKLNFSIFKNSLSLWIIGIFLLLILPFPDAASASAITPTNLIERTNQERDKYGLVKLEEDELLTKAALAKAKDILQQQKFSHNFSDKKFSQWIKDAGYQYSIVGENLAVNFTDSEPLFNAWLASPTHKKNILHKDYNEIGAAAVKGSWFGEETIIAVELFGAPAILMSPTASSEQSVPAPISGAIEANTYSAPAYFNASNLSEYYLNNTTAEKYLPVFSPAEKIKVNNIIKNKTAVLYYFLTAVKIMILYMSLMLAMVLIYFYAGYLTGFNKKLQLLCKP
ncbi:hypothetical protein COT99_02065 [Candidatus Falkowbacteria bacterium CG10_big_fil_rev_8_21_14_0_10_43_10]|uniref:SCP domain-containing protein n=1 Tax=Candidatus Falkowbacteria bacterium CG10_big_fil_rev_8_21_14_0_10_43_10 TaxID=1974567 RepID=A0A2H0V2B1_9BACT|nr:MAG: hypothetical protein COT99_02065 [Candidatus Falkowbacteria bacterium CG10_big_fil_rev_8_21_14_0_10_43_10]